MIIRLRAVNRHLRSAEPVFPTTSLKYNWMRSTHGQVARPRLTGSYHSNAMRRGPLPSNPSGITALDARTVSNSSFRVPLSASTDSFTQSHVMILAACEPTTSHAFDLLPFLFLPDAATPDCCDSAGLLASPAEVRGVLQSPFEIAASDLPDSRSVFFLFISGTTDSDADRGFDDGDTSSDSLLAAGELPSFLCVAGGLDGGDFAEEGHPVASGSWTRDGVRWLLGDGDLSEISNRKHCDVDD